MTDDFRVSVAIPAFNEERRIAAAIASVHAQTEPPAEIFVVDDGSSDATAAIATSLGARVVVQPNGGVARARNRLLQEARAPWLAFLDADDVWYPDKLAALRRAHERRPTIDFLISDLRCRRATGAIATESVFATTPQYAALAKESIDPEIARLERHALGRALAVGNFIGTSTVVVRRAPLVERGCLFAEDLPATPDVFVAEDVEWYLRVLRSTDVLAVTRCLAEYRWRPGSLAADYARVRSGDVVLGERVAARPDVYVDGAAAAFGAARRRQLRHAARISAGSAHFVRARALLLQAQLDEPRPLDALALQLLRLAETSLARRGLGVLQRVRARLRAVR